ncbi:hypothetical protein [Planctomycetes bacterium TBK1r]|uniref:Uncharacterized protein n=1 Tax=Stieleria magnilauensis TaxID=2527963 RepID=A0ABX5XTA9_9BACT|nr:hypothetical protein TBK1r_42160 [Planctomycetes bacterium TBK1r]
MNETTSVKRSFNVQRKSHGRRAVVSGTAPTPPPVGRLPRITRLMALAIHFDDLLRTGVVRSQAELAKLGQVTRPRLTQIMNLLYLCPSIQDAILFHPPITSGRDPITERDLRAVSRSVNWREQRRIWSQIGG